MRAQLARDAAAWGREWRPDWPAYILDRYRIDLSTEILGVPVPHPIGKGSGQLSLRADQLEADADAGLAFAVLKTVIADLTMVDMKAFWGVLDHRRWAYP